MTDGTSDPEGGTAGIRILVDGDRCVGSGNCLYWAPHTFDLDDSGLSVVVDPTGDPRDRIEVAVEGCPTRALSIQWLAPGERDDEPAGSDRAEVERAEGVP